MTAVPQGHSPLGGSAAPRFLKCAASARLGYAVPDEESDYSAAGNLAHDLAQWTLEQGADAWMEIGSKFPNGVAGKEEADAVQVFVNAVRSEHPRFNPKVPGNWGVEDPFYCPSIHEYFWGRADFWAIEEGHLHVWDYKHGAGVTIEVPWNAQCLYYACGVLEEHDLWHVVEEVTLHIAQPRGSHTEGPLREWSLSTDALQEWLEDVLIPGMDLALTSDQTASGEHCRFCPARRRACPQLLRDFDELEEMLKMFDEKGAAPEMTNEQVGRFLALLDVAKIAGKAANETAFARMQAGHKVPGRKLVRKQTNRKWKEGAEPALREKYGDRAMTTPELKSPAQIEALAEGKKMTTRWAEKPDGGLTVASDADPRASMAQSAKRMFQSKTKEKADD